MLFQMPVDRTVRDEGSRLCAQTDPEEFFPGKGESVRRAKRVCMACTSRVACLEEALADPTLQGIWGGTSERERKHMRTAARRAEQDADPHQAA